MVARDSMGVVLYNCHNCPCTEWLYFVASLVSSRKVEAESPMHQNFIHLTFFCSDTASVGAGSIALQVDVKVIRMLNANAARIVDSTGGGSFMCPFGLQPLGRWL